MAIYPDDLPLKPRRFSAISSSLEEPVDAPSEPIVLALLVANALQQAGLGMAVLEMRASPTGWVSFLTELDTALREDARG